MLIAPKRPKSPKKPKKIFVRGKYEEEKESPAERRKKVDEIWKENMEFEIRKKRGKINI